ncbi:MAG: prephenate dehydratase [Bacteroidota bacterium]|nr:prephenate dehydratase [Bacteroidota bacterium]MEC8636326.1 prephenate dehydratase [Bacteroidota bacterium]
MMQKIAIQGIKGSFHDQVVEEYYAQTPELLECLTFDALAKSVARGNCDQAVMAIENSIAGSILPNYALLDQYELVISGEHYLSIEHNLMTLPGQKMEDIKEIHSHPMALLQCKKFFYDYPHIKLVESNDTAEEALKISQNKITGRGAIAGKTAAEIYGLEILCPSIQTIKNNVTRFVIVQKDKVEHSKSFSKAAWKFVLDHKRGSLATALNVMSDCNLNLTKIQSLPVIETPGKYAFFVDVTFDDTKDYFKAKSLLEIMATAFKVLGEYPSGKL